MCLCVFVCLSALLFTFMYNGCGQAFWVLKTSPIVTLFVCFACVCECFFVYVCLFVCVYLFIYLFVCVCVCVCWEEELARRVLASGLELDLAEEVLKGWGVVCVCVWGDAAA